MDKANNSKLTVDINVSVGHDAEITILRDTRVVTGILSRYVVQNQTTVTVQDDVTAVRQHSVSWF